jgi:hypothetical protein
MTTKHTPGPWFYGIGIRGYGDYTLQITGDKGRTIFIAPIKTDGTTQYTIGELKEHESNARLIAAAPDLLGALKSILRWREGTDNYKIAESKALFAIAKAEGTI